MFGVVKNRNGRDTMVPHEPPFSGCKTEFTVKGVNGDVTPAVKLVNVNRACDKPCTCYLQNLGHRWCFYYKDVPAMPN